MTLGHVSLYILAEKRQRNYDIMNKRINAHLGNDLREPSISIKRMGLIMMIHLRLSHTTGVIDHSEC